MSANFTPEMLGYTGQGPFRYWCQKVLPLVYDDSLSYLEVLHKVTNYLNNTISDVANVETNVDNLATAFNNLQRYVNEHIDAVEADVEQFEEYVTNYLTNLDVQEEINTKLDAMAASGTLGELLLGEIYDPNDPDNSLISQLVSDWLNDAITGPAPGEAVAVDGTLTISGAAADAKVTGDVRNSLDDVEASLGKTVLPYMVTVGGSINASDGSDDTSEYYSRIEYIDIGGKEKITVNSNRYRIYYYLYRSNYTVISSNGWLSGKNEITVGSAKYIRLVVRQPAGQTAVSPTETEITTNISIYDDIMDDVADRIETLESVYDSYTPVITRNTNRIAALEKLSGEVFNDLTVVVGGSINGSDGGNSTSEYYSRVEYVDVEGKFSVTINPGNLGAYVYTYRSDGTKYGNTDWIYEPTTYHYNLSVKYIRMVMRYPSGQTQVSPTETDVLSNLKITAVNKATVSNERMRQNFIPAKSTRYIYAKGKMWEYSWNTVPAIKAACKEDDCWGVSADVRVTSDGYLVCYHDATVDAQTDGTGQIEGMTWSQVQALNIDRGVWNGSAWVGQPDGQYGKIPLLSDVIDACKLYGKVLLIEPKAQGSSAIGNLGTEDLEAVMLLLRNKGMLDCCGFIAPTTTQTYLENNYPNVFRFRLYDDSLTSSGLNVYAYDPNTVYGAYNSALSEAIVSRVHRMGMYVVGYTPRTNPQSDDVQMVGKGLDGIFLFREPPVIS